MVELLKDIGVGVASGLGQEGIKLAMKKMLAQDIASRDPIIYFGLWCNFREMPLYDVASAELNETLKDFNGSGPSLIQGKNTFDYDISWKTLEGCEIPEEQWEYDAVLEEEVSDFEEEPAECVLGFTLWLLPRSLGERKDMIISAYHILNQIERKIMENRKLPNLKTASFAFVRAEKETCLKIHLRLNKKINGNEKTRGLLGVIDESPLGEDMMILSIPLHEFVVAEAFADSFSIWGSIK